MLLVCAALVVMGTGPASASEIVALWDFWNHNIEVRGGIDCFKPDLGSFGAEVFLIGGVEYDDPFNPLSKDWEKGKPSDCTESSDPSTLWSDSLDTATYPVQGTGNRTAGIEIKCPTTGYAGISFSFDVKKKLNCSKYMRVLYSTDGGATWNHGPLFAGEFVAFDPYFPAPGTNQISKMWFNGNTADFTSVTAADNNPNFRLRVVTEFAPGTNQYEGCALDGTRPDTSTTPWTFPVRLPYKGGDNDHGGDQNNHRFDMIRVSAQQKLSGPSPTPVTILEAKQTPDYQRVAINNAKVSYASTDWLALQSDSGGTNCGIRVYYPAHGMQTGWRINVVGDTRTRLEGERYIRAAFPPEVADNSPSETANTIKPVCCLTKNCGGAAANYNPTTGAGQMAMGLGRGANNVGMLVRVCGTVTLRDDVGGTALDWPNYFYLDEGAHFVDGNAIDGFWIDWSQNPPVMVPISRPGLKVLPETASWPIPGLEIGSRVVVTGVVCGEVAIRKGFEQPWVFCPCVRASSVEVLPEF